MLGKIGVAVQLLLGLGLGFLGGLVDGVAFLPPELAGAQERTGGFLPADDAAPLVMMMAPIRRVDAPQEVWNGYCRVLSRPVKVTS